MGLREIALKQLHELRPVPSVAMHDVPRESVGQHLGLFRDDQLGSRDELDDRLARMFTRLASNARSYRLLHRTFPVCVQPTGTRNSRLSY